jgi:hypothetical protein
LAEAFGCCTGFRFIAARFKRWDTVIRTGRCVGSEPTCADSITTSSHTIGEFSGRGFLVESINPAQPKRGGRERL